MAAGHSVDDYLETIYFLAFPIGEYRPDTKGSPTLAVRVADMLGVSRASAGEMLKRLEAEGLVERGEHKEAILTAKGRAQAERVVRRHRIIERLLTDFMGYTPAEAHEQADLLGNTFTDEMVERIATQLGNPDRCPHGWPVDTDFEQAENRELQPLSDLAAGSRGRDRPPRRARRRSPALVLRRGPRARHAHRAARGRRRRVHPQCRRRRASARREAGRRPLRARYLGLLVLEDDVHRREAERAQEAREHRARVFSRARAIRPEPCCAAAFIFCTASTLSSLLVVVVRRRRCRRSRSARPRPGRRRSSESGRCAPVRASAAAA